MTFGFVTGFQTGDNLTGSQDLWFITYPGTGDWWPFSLAANEYWMSHPTIAVDEDLDIYFGSTWFNANNHPWTVWDMYEGLNPLIFEGQNYLENSTVEYTGNPNLSFQRWGDYNTMVYDPDAPGPSGEGSLWEVEETTCSSLFQNSPNFNCSSTQTAGEDESTTWLALADPLPWFVGSNNVESECPDGPGHSCSVTISPPAGVQQGDVLLTTLLMGQTSSTLPGVSSGWTLLSASNIINAPQQIDAEDSCGFVISSWLAAHVYGTNEPSSYTFSHYDRGFKDSCNGTSYNAELGAFMTVYRGAGQNTGAYTGYGFSQYFDSQSISTAAITPPAETELMTVFAPDLGTDVESSEPSVTFGYPGGTPGLTVETSLTPTALPFLDADVGVPSGSELQYGGYTVGATVSCTKCLSQGPWLAWQVAIPEQ